MSYVLDTGKCKIGDGESRWADLPYITLDTDIDKKVDIIIKTEEEWKDFDKEISVKGNVYVYTSDDVNSNAPPKIKLGDGLAYICDLPLITDGVLNKLSNHTNDNKVHITDEERVFWNNKITAYIHKDDPDTLVLDNGTLQYF